VTASPYARSFLPRVERFHEEGSVTLQRFLPDSLQFHQTRTVEFLVDSHETIIHMSNNFFTVQPAGNCVKYFSTARNRVSALHAISAYNLVCKARIPTNASDDENLTFSLAIITDVTLIFAHPGDLVPSSRRPALLI
jgi:hypothetical protein